MHAPHGQRIRLQITCLTVILLAGAAPLAAVAGDYHAPRNAAGQPDLEGVWANGSFTGLERPKTLKGLVISEQEAKASEANFTRTGNAAGNEDPLGQKESEFWDVGSGFARVRGQIRTSWIVDTSDGRLPFRPEIVKRFHYDDPNYVRPMENPEERSVTERCVASEGGYPPNLPSPDGNYLQIMQTKDSVVLVAEKYNDLRIVRMGGSHAPAQVRSWAGDAVGHWEGETLVVENTNFSPSGFSRTGRLKLSAESKVVERFTRVGPSEILYAFSVTDPTVYTQTWRAEMPFHKTAARMFEYACHEGNYFLGAALAAARAAERQQAAK